MIDLALTILVLGVVISVGLNLAVRTEKKAREDSMILSEDKNTRSLRGYGINEYGDFDGNFTAKELALMIQVQDYEYIPGPRKVTIDIDKEGSKRDDDDDDDIEIERDDLEREIVSTYKDELARYGRWILDILTDDKTGYSEDTRFRVRLKESSDGTEDTYIIEAVNN